MGDAASFPLWDFSIRVYGAPGVKSACLQLQDEHGVDVNVMFAVLFAAVRGVVLDEQEQRELLLSTADVRGLVGEIRDVRRRVGTQRDEAAAEREGLDAVYDAMLRAELSAEQVVQRHLDRILSRRIAAASQRSGDEVAAARAALRIHAAVVGARQDLVGSGHRLLEHVLGAAFESEDSAAR